MPTRIQRKRTKGWRMPQGAVSVCRPGEWGNPHKVGVSLKKIDDPKYHYRRMTPQDAVDAYRADLPFWIAEGMVPPIETLRGKDLACWCPLDQPCHADVLLETANPKR
jgi:hypothetical protein